MAERLLSLPARMRALAAAEAAPPWIAGAGRRHRLRCFSAHRASLTPLVFLCLFFLPAAIASDGGGLMHRVDAASQVVIKANGQLVSDPQGKDAAEDAADAAAWAADHAASGPTPGAATLPPLQSYENATGDDANNTLCEDAPSSGVAFKLPDGNQRVASCHELHHYCQSAKFGSTIQSNCKKTCGHCTLELVAASCDDKGADVYPQFHLQNEPAPCESLRPFCYHSYEHAAILRTKCPKTCMVCSAGEADAQGPTGHQTVGMGCNRRRWGYCSTRRRDVPGQQQDQDAEEPTVPNDDTTETVSICIGASGETPGQHCVDAGEPVSCSPNAGDPTERLNSDEADPLATFNIEVDGNQVCATRTDKDAAWTLNLTIYCTAVKAEGQEVGEGSEGASEETQDEPGVLTPPSTHEGANACEAETDSGACVFPFVWNGATYNSCTTTGHEGTFWCATAVGANNAYNGSWGACTEQKHCASTDTEVNAKHGEADQENKKGSDLSELADKLGNEVSELKKKVSDANGER